MRIRRLNLLKALKINTWHIFFVLAAIITIIDLYHSYHKTTLDHKPLESITKNLSYNNCVRGAGNTLFSLALVIFSTAS